MPNPYLVNEIQLSYKCHAAPDKMPKVYKTEQAYNIFLNHWDDNCLELQEQSKTMLLNRAGRVLGLYHLGTGSLRGTIIDRRLIFVAALKTNAASIILAHNHPSGNLTPSQADINVTAKITDACELLDIEMRDHIIVTRHGFYSFAEDTAYQKVQRNGQFYYECLMPF